MFCESDLSILPSIRLFFCEEIFSELDCYFFPNYDMVLETDMKLCVAAVFFEKNVLLKK